MSQPALKRESMVAWQSGVSVASAILTFYASCITFSQPFGLSATFVGAFVTGILALWGAALKPTKESIIFSTIGFGLALIVSWVVLQDSYMLTSHYPWTVVVGLIVLSVFGGWFANLRHLSFSCAVIAGLWLLPTFRAPSVSLPSTQTLSGLRCTLVACSKNACAFKLSNADGSPVSSRFDVTTLSANANAGSLIPSRQVDEENEPQTEKVAGKQLIYRSHSLGIPPWARSCDITLYITPLSDIVDNLTVPLKPGGSYRSSFSDGTFSVVPIGWRDSGSRRHLFRLKIFCSPELKDSFAVYDERESILNYSVESPGPQQSEYSYLTEEIVDVAVDPNQARSITFGLRSGYVDPISFHFDSVPVGR